MPTTDIVVSGRCEGRSKERGVVKEVDDERNGEEGARRACGRVDKKLKVDRAARLRDASSSPHCPTEDVARYSKISLNDAFYRFFGRHPPTGTIGACGYSNRVFARLQRSLSTLDANPAPSTHSCYAAHDLI
jgi:hypothetical protein